jgi:hypothetical protein
VRFGVASLEDGDQGVSQLITAERALVHVLGLAHQVHLQRSTGLRACPQRHFPKAGD